MKAPIDKLVTGRNGIIQLIVTHRCDRACSNCTQAVTYKGKGYDMSPAVFRQACESLADWPGHVGMFGGNPVLHPQFDELCAIMQEIIEPEHRGLWCNDVFNKGAVAAETFSKGYLNLNAHGSPEAFDRIERWFPGRAIPESRDRASWHSPIYTAIRDFVGSEEIPDEKAMWAMIEKCPINNDWSGAIAERDGQAKAYFCEVAAMFDIVYDRDHGVRVVPGWWEWGMDRFEHQSKQWCVQCGIPMNLKGHQDLADTDDYSKTHEKLVTLNVRRKAVRHDDLPSARAHRATDYERRHSTEEVTA